VASDSTLRRGQQRGAVRVVVVAGALALSALAGAVDSLTLPAAALVLVVGGMVVVAALRRRPAKRRPAPDRLDPVGLWPWLALVFAFAAWELVALRLGSTPDHPSLSILLDPVLDDQLVRSAAFLAWLSLGAYLARR
jgi:hypothetical protein